MRRSVEAGINKINVGTDYMIAQREFVAKALAENPGYDYPTLVEDSWKAGIEVIKRYIEISGSAGKITISGGVFNTSAIRSALAAAREYMVIRRDTAMTAFKIMVK